MKLYIDNRTGELTGPDDFIEAPAEEILSHPVVVEALREARLAAIIALRHDLLDLDEANEADANRAERDRDMEAMKAEDRIGIGIGRCLDVVRQHLAKIGYQPVKAAAPPESRTS